MSRGLGDVYKRQLLHRWRPPSRGTQKLPWDRSLWCGPQNRRQRPDHFESAHPSDFGSAGVRWMPPFPDAPTPLCRCPSAGLEPVDRAWRSAGRDTAGRRPAPRQDHLSAIGYDCVQETFLRITAEDDRPAEPPPPPCSRYRIPIHGGQPGISPPCQR